MVICGIPQRKADTVWLMYLMFEILTDYNKLIDGQDSLPRLLLSKRKGMAAYLIPHAGALRSTCLTRKGTTPQFPNYGRQSSAQAAGPRGQQSIDWATSSLHAPERESAYPPNALPGESGRIGGSSSPGIAALDTTVQQQLTLLASVVLKIPFVSSSKLEGSK